MTHSLKEGIRFKLPLIVYPLFLIGTFITVWIVYQDIDTSFSYKFIISYVVFLLLLVVYIIVIMVLNLRKLQWHDVRKRLYKFIVLFVLMTGVNYFILIGMKAVELDAYRVFSMPLGLALGYVFFDSMFVKKK